jgi:hypothetical protein
MYDGERTNNAGKHARRVGGGGGLTVYTILCLSNYGPRGKILTVKLVYLKRCGISEKMC